MKKKRLIQSDIQVSEVPVKAEQEGKPGTMLKWFTTRQGRGTFFSGLFVVALVMTYFASSICSDHINAAYHSAKEDKIDDVYSLFYNTAYDYTENKNHLSNRVVISIKDMAELSQLEVLTVSDTEFVIEKEEDNKKGITSWIEVQGIGVFTVNMQMAEFITDDQRHHVLVRVGNPELTQCNIEKVGNIFWYNEGGNDSVKDGVGLSLRQMSEGRQLIEDSIRQNRDFYDSAQKAAESSIESLVKSWNPQLPDMIVEVEFVGT